jgi:hypothetical protein
MRVAVPHQLFELLVQRQVERGYVDDVTRGTGAVWLHTDMGPSFYLTRDGCILTADAFDDTGLREASPSETYAGLVAGARTVRSPELLSLLPQKPPTADVCPACRGSHWSPIHPGMRASDPGYFEIVCVHCRGLGWVDTPGGP